MTKSGITFADQWHTERDWNLHPVRIYISMPEVKEQVIDIPGGDGAIDLSEINGRPMYGMRTVELEYHLRNVDNEKWNSIYSEIGAAITGKKVKMVLDDDPDHYYMARLKVDGEKTDYVNAELTFSGTAEPFKYDLTATNEPWLWDTFNFETGIIRELEDVKITKDNRTITVSGGGEIDDSPKFIVSQADNLKLVYKGRIYTLKTGENRFPAVRVGKEDVQLKFVGTGELAIKYRDRRL